MVEPTYLSNTIVQYDDTNICVRQQLDGAVEFPVGAVCIYEATISTDRISRAWSIRDAHNFKTQASIDHGAYYRWPLWNGDRPHQGIDSAAPDIYRNALTQRAPKISVSAVCGHEN